MTCTERSRTLTEMTKRNYIRHLSIEQVLKIQSRREVKCPEETYLKCAQIMLRTVNLSPV